MESFQEQGLLPSELRRKVLEASAELKSQSAIRALTVRCRRTIEETIEGALLCNTFLPIPILDSDQPNMAAYMTCLACKGKQCPKCGFNKDGRGHTCSKVSEQYFECNGCAYALPTSSLRNVQACGGITCPDVSSNMVFFNYAPVFSMLSIFIGAFNKSSRTRSMLLIEVVSKPLAGTLLGSVTRTRTSEVDK